MNYYPELKMIQEAGTPALSCFKPEEQPTGCRITSVINMIIRVRAKPPFLRLRPGLGIYQSRHRPVIMVNSHTEYLKLCRMKMNKSNLSKKTVPILPSFTRKLGRLLPVFALILFSLILVKFSYAASEFVVQGASAVLPRGYMNGNFSAAINLNAIKIQHG